MVEKQPIICCCKGIVVNSQGELISITDNNTVIIGCGSSSRTVVDLGIYSNFLIAIDKFDVIYCARGNELLRCNLQGVVDAKRVDNSSTKLTALTVVGDEVMTCNASSTIKIYDRDLNYVRSIEYDGMGGFNDISSDSQGNLYVAVDMSVKYSIVVFSNAGNYLRSFTLECFEKCIQTLCVSGQYVYVIGEPSTYNPRRICIYHCWRYCPRNSPRFKVPSLFTCGQGWICMGR